MRSKSSARISITESPSNFDNLDVMSVEELLIHINEEDSKVHLAVSKALPQIRNLIEQIEVRMKKGGRIFYLGAGTSGRLGVLDASEIPPTFGVPDNMVIGQSQVEIWHCENRSKLQKMILTRLGHHFKV